MTVAGQSTIPIRRPALRPAEQGRPAGPLAERGAKDGQWSTRAPVQAPHRAVPGLHPGRPALRLRLRHVRTYHEERQGAGPNSGPLRAHRPELPFHLRLRVPHHLHVPDPMVFRMRMLHVVAFQFSLLLIVRSLFMIFTHMETPAGAVP